MFDPACCNAMHGVLCVHYRLEMRRAVAVSISQFERRVLLIYCGWEIINLFLGGVLSSSFVRWVGLTGIQTVKVSMPSGISRADSCGLTRSNSPQQIV